MVRFRLVLKIFISISLTLDLNVKHHNEEYIVSEVRNLVYNPCDGNGTGTDITLRQPGGNGNHLDKVSLIIAVERPTYAPDLRTRPTHQTYAPDLCTRSTHQTYA